jgi:hypothetical protein
MEAMEGLVGRLRRTDGALPEWRLAFELVRVLKALPGEGPFGWERVALQYFSLMGLNPAEAWGRFVDCWDKVEHPTALDGWDAAARLAELGPAEFTPSPGLTYIGLARACFHLSMAKKGGRFPVPVSRVARILGISERAATNAIRALVRAGVLECVDEEYSFTKGRAKEFRFLARVARSGEGRQ